MYSNFKQDVFRICGNNENL